MEIEPNIKDPKYFRESMIDRIKIIEQSLELKEFNLNFNARNWECLDLCGVVLFFFNHYDATSYFGIDEKDLIEFILEVKELYYDNPYHSFHHALDVCVMIFYFLNNFDVQLTTDSKINLIVSGLCHDIGHPGLNNLYHVNTNSELAKEFNNESVLENHSCNLTIDLLEKHLLITKINIDELVDNILATDMSHHFNLVQEISESIETKKELDTKTITKIILHASDISNPVRPWDLCKTWSHLVVEEFFNQGDLEKKQNLAITPNMDRDTSNQIEIALDFDEYIVQPFFKLLTSIFPKSQIFVDNLNYNREQWISLQIKSNTRLDSLKNKNIKRVSFPAGTILIPDFWLDDDKRHSGDCSKAFLNYKKRPTSYYIKRKRHGCPPDKMNFLNSLLKNSLVGENIDFT